MDEFTPLERAVMDKLLEGDEPESIALRAQWHAATVASRDYSGVGFFTELKVPAELTLPDKPPRLTISGVIAFIEGIPHGAGFVVFVKDGLLDTLEGFTYDGEWPAEIGSFALVHLEDLPSATSGRRRGGRA